MELKPITWIGSSRSDLKTFPAEVQDSIGYSLYEAQLGYFPDAAKPLKGLNGVIEIVTNWDKDTYRTVYVAKLSDQIFVLHVFQKKSKKGIKTPKEEIALLKQRLKTAKLLSESNL